MYKKRNPNTKGYKINNKNIISDKTSYINNLQLFANEFKDEKIFINFDKNKTPYQPNSKKLAKANEQSTWGKLNEAIKGLKKNNIIGVGIELGKTSNGNLCAIDIDECFNEKGKINQEAQNIINLFNSFSEISLNGNGLHVLFYARKKGNRCKISNLSFCKHLEIYDGKHYLALTGNVIKNQKIMLRQNECNEFYDRYFKNHNNILQNKQIIETYSEETEEKHKNNFFNALKNNKKLSEYWNGLRPLKDESADDFGFAIKILQQVPIIDVAIKLFLMSPYFKQKDTTHKNKCLFRNDYLTRTFTNALWRI